MIQNDVRFANGLARCVLGGAGGARARQEKGRRSNDGSRWHGRVSPVQYQRGVAPTLLRRPS